MNLATRDVPAAGPLSAYCAAIASDRYHADPHQAMVAEKLQALYTLLVETQKRWFWQRRQPVSGLYIHGGVGRGKTWLMDLFFEALPKDTGRRIHFHRFMRKVHQERQALGDHRDPLRAIAERWADEYRVLCLDEFFVSDIGDAMLLAGLLEGLFRRGVTLVTTSNLPPAQLYADGLQRARFLPAIALLEEHTDVVSLDTPHDYRLRILQSAATWYTPLGAATESRLEALFDQVCPVADKSGGMIEINDRHIATRARGNGVIWFDFDPLFRSDRSADDYIEIARSFNTVLISNVPILTADDADAARRFVTAIDEFYDRNIKVICSAVVGIGEVYQGQRLAFEFERTHSRLIEMQSAHYLASEHRAG